MNRARENIWVRGRKAAASNDVAWWISSSQSFQRSISHVTPPPTASTVSRTPPTEFAMIGSAARHRLDGHDAEVLDGREHVGERARVQRAEHRVGRRDDERHVGPGRRRPRAQRDMAGSGAGDDDRHLHLRADLDDPVEALVVDHARGAEQELRGQRVELTLLVVGEVRAPVVGRHQSLVSTGG